MSKLISEKYVNGQRIREYDYSDECSGTFAEDVLNNYFSQGHFGKPGFIRISSLYMQQKFGYYVPNLLIDSGSGVVYIINSNADCESITPMLNPDGTPFVISAKKIETERNTVQIIKDFANSLAKETADDYQE